MNWINQTVAEFGLSIGIPTLALDEKLSLRLQMQDNSSIFISHLPNLAIPEVLVGRSITMQYKTTETLRAALKSADFRTPTQWPLQVAANDKELIFVMRITERAFVLNVLEKALVYLTELSRKINA
jgi:hypothetical protein